MALTGKKYEKFYKETGSGSDKIAAANKDYIKTVFEYSATHGFHDIMDDYRLGPIIYMMQQMQDELDYLRTEISTNKDKTGISTSQASAITANTAKTGITSTQATSITENANSIAANKTALGNITTFPGFGTTKDTALKGNTYIPPIQVSLALGLILSIQIRMVPPQKGQKKGTAQLGWILEDTINRVLYQGTPQTLV